MTGIERSSARWRSRLTASSRATLAEMSPVCSTVIAGCAAPTARTERRKLVERYELLDGADHEDGVPVGRDAGLDVAADRFRETSGDRRRRRPELRRRRRGVSRCGGTRTREPAAKRDSSSISDSRSPTRLRRRSAAPQFRSRSPRARRGLRTKATPRSPTMDGVCSSGRPTPPTSSAESRGDQLLAPDPPGDAEDVPDIGVRTTPKFARKSLQSGDAFFPTTPPVEKPQRVSERAPMTPRPPAWMIELNPPSAVASGNVGEWKDEP